MQIWANYNQKYQDINIHKHGRLLLLGSSGQASAICCWISLPPLFFVCSKNCEFMQTINDKWKYKLQQLFEKLFLSLDTGLESFSPLVSGPINHRQFEVSRDLNQSLLQFSQVACCVLLHGAVVAIETTQLALNLYIKLFKRNQSTIKCRCILWKSLITGAFWRSYANLL